MEDNRGIADAIKAQAEMWDLQVRCVENFHDVMGEFAAFDPHLVLLATVLMIYYKQISEGYEDQARFTIMRKVGMTRENIHRSVNFQMLAVFCLPLVTAGIHLCFAFPMVRKLLLLFNLTNTPLMITTAAIRFLLFSLFYALVYRITSNVYYRIVSGARDEE